MRANLVFHADVGGGGLKIKGSHWGPNNPDELFGGLYSRPPTERN